MSNFGTLAHPKGRKLHKCGWCGEDILVAEKHAHFTGMWQGEFQNWRMHEECHEAYGEGDEDDGFMFGEQKRGKNEGR